VTKNNKTPVEVERPKPPTVGRSSLQDQQFEERLRIAEGIVQALPEVGYSCEPADDGRIEIVKGWRRSPPDHAMRYGLGPRVTCQDDNTGRG
jgi:hypothetical protein